MRGDARLAHQPGHAVRQHAGLSAPRPGQHQQGAVLVENRLALGWIEAGEEV